ncbi:MAG: hypothetical protein ACRCUS_00350, partial [Anaerovoracaceae bacterium]
MLDCRHRKFSKIVVFLLVFTLLFSAVNLPQFQINALAASEREAILIGDEPVNEDTLNESNEIGGMPDTAVETGGGKINNQNEIAYSDWEKFDTPPEKQMSLSDEFSDVFENPDGTITKIQYFDPVNYIDESGELHEIQTGIVPRETASEEISALSEYLSLDRITALALEEMVVIDENAMTDDFAFSNKSGPVQVLLPDNIVSYDPVQVNMDRYSISMRPIYQMELNMGSGGLNFEDLYDAASLTVQTNPDTEPMPIKPPAEDETTVEMSLNEQSQMLIKPLSEENVANEITSTEEETFVDEVQIEQQPVEAAQILPENTQVAPPIPAINGIIMPEIEVADEYLVEENAVFVNYKDQVITFDNAAEKSEAIAKGFVEEEITALSYLTKYDEQKNSVEIQYTPGTYGVKEDIILREYTGINSFEFLLSLGELRPEIDEAGHVLLYDPN